MGSPLLDIFLKWKISFSFRNVLHISCSKYLLISHCSHIELNFTLRFHSGIPFYCKRKPSYYWAKTSLTHFQINSFRKVKEKQCSVLFRFLHATLTLKFSIYDSFCKWERINSLSRIFLIYHGKPLWKSSYFGCFERSMLQNYKSPLQWENTCSESTIQTI